MNPRSGGGKARKFDLRLKAERLGATVVMLAGDDDVTTIAGGAVREGADLLGVAGGDGTLALVAGVAAEHGVPLLVIPAGTRNHFAMDLGLDRARPYRALHALTDGAERIVDLGDVSGRPFVNNVSFGAYAEIVERPDYRDNRLRVSLEALPEVFAARGPRFAVHWDHTVLHDPLVALVSNNPYGGRRARGPGRRPSLETGILGLICVQPPPDVPAAQLRERRLHRPAVVTTAAEVSIDSTDPILLAAIDGEPVHLTTPVRCRIRSRALRVRVPASYRLS